MTGASPCRYESVCERERLERAWMEVWSRRTHAARGQGAGVDGVTLAQWAVGWPTRIDRLASALRQGQYRPSPLLRAEIVSRSGEARQLGIPTVTDRVVQRAAKNLLEPIWEQVFLPCNHGFRPGRSTTTAVTQILRYEAAGLRWALKGDIRRCFDTIHHEPLLDQVSREADDRIIALIEGWLRVGACAPRQGLAQGATISPLLANIYLHPFDVQMARAGLALVRYADDFVVMCASFRDAAEALGEVEAGLGTLRLDLSPDKVAIARYGSELQFLGAQFEG